MGRPDFFTDSPSLKRWMMFVDGENFTIRAQEYANNIGLELRKSEYWFKNTFVWIPKVAAKRTLRPLDGVYQLESIRSYYYTSFSGDKDKERDIKEALWSLGFHPEIFKKTKQNDKAKGVDIALTKDLLSHAFLDNYDAAVLIAGDGDYVPLVNEVKRLGKIVEVMFFSNSSDFKSGLNLDLKHASDRFYSINNLFLKSWKEWNK